MTATGASTTATSPEPDLPYSDVDAGLDCGYVLKPEAKASKAKK